MTTATHVTIARAPAALGVLALALLAACRLGEGPCQPYEGNVLNYGFALNGDSSLIFHWPASYMPVRVYAPPGGRFNADVQNAMLLWQHALRCGEVSFTLATDSTKADIVATNPSALPPGVLGGGGATGDSVNACQGVTDFGLDATGKALAGPIHMYVAPFPGMDTTAVASCYHFVTAHELGHALGIWAHSTDTNDIMYPTPRRTLLSAADRYTIQLLYHWPPTIGPPPR